MRGRSVALFVVGAFIASIAAFQQAPKRAVAVEGAAFCTAGGTTIATGPDGNIWFGQSYDREIARLVPSSGRIDETVPLFAPHSDIVPGSDGNVWTIEGVFAMIVRPDLTNDSFELPWTSSPENGGTIAGPDGNVWLFRRDGAKAEFLRIAPDRTVTVLEPAMPFLSRAGELLAGPDGAMWFFAKTEAESSVWRLYRATYDLSDVREVAAHPHLSVAGPLTIDGNVWFIRFTPEENDELVRVDADGIAQVVTIPGVPAATRPTAGPDGRIWFGSRANGNVSALALDGTLSEYPAGLGGIEHMTVGPDGTMWFTTDSHVASIALDGTVLASYEIPASRWEPATCSITPDRGSTAAGQILTIRGRGFSRADRVLIAGREVPFTILSDFEISATTVPMSAGDHAVMVDETNSIVPSPNVFFRAIGPPHARRACPNNGSIEGGYRIVVTGRDMDTARSVDFGNRGGISTDVAPVYNDYGYVVRDAISVRVPAGRGGSIRLIASSEYGRGPKDALFTYTRLPSSVDPCTSSLVDELAAMLPSA
jgi:streptogramin lyase